MFFAGAGFEPQYWTSLGQSLIFDGFSGSDIGLAGFTVNSGIRR